MKIVCLDNINGIGSKLPITVGKIYDVIKISDSHYYIFDDKGFQNGYYKYRFIPLKDYRTERLKEILT